LLGSTNPPRLNNRRHTAITTAIEHGQKAGVGLDQIRHFSRHRMLATMLIYRNERDREVTQRARSPTSSPVTVQVSPWLTRQRALADERRALPCHRCCLFVYNYRGDGHA
jgi:hypothetical protein